MEVAGLVHDVNKSLTVGEPKQRVDGRATHVDGDQPTVEASDDASATLAGGEVLPRMVVEQGLWFAWFGNHPETDLWPGS